MDLEPSQQHQEKLHLRELTYALFFLSLLITFISFSIITTPSFTPHYYLLPVGLWSQFIPKNNQNSSSSTTTKLANCDYSNGRWVFDQSYPPRTYTEDCPFLDPGFRCHHSGRPDRDYAKWRWQPHGCDLPRFNATDFLERSRNGQIVFAGDSIGRNQWESLLCMLSQGVSNLSTIHEENGSPITKHKGFLSVRFQEYNLTVQYYRVPFLVEVHRPPKNSPPAIRKAIRVDSFHWFSNKFVRADVLIFNAGHWWNQDKTTKMGWYFQEGANINMTMNVTTAFQKSLQTWKSWTMQNLDPKKSHIFFRSYSPTHYRNGTWNEGGYCDTYTQPETDQAKIEADPLTNKFIYDVVRRLELGTKQLKVKFLNITYLTEVRKDGHPSRHREPGTPPDAPQDCSHWCLPGVPDTWNELVYAHLLSMGFRTRQKNT